MFQRRFLANDPARPALHTPETGWLTYGELRARGESAARGLAADGVRPGDVVAIHLENGLDLVDAHLGCIALGAIRLPLNAHYREAELRPILEDAAPVRVLTRSPGRFGGLATAPAARLVPGDAFGPWAENDLTALLFTSGTTGRPKGVPQTFTMWEANLDALAGCWGLTGDDCLLLALPLFHTHGLVLGLHGTLLRGARAVLLPRFEPTPPPPEVTHVYGVPTWYRRWLPVMQADPAPFRRLSLLVSGSDGLDKATSDAVYEATGHRILERYGMTETVMICSNPGRGERRAGTVGPPVPGVSVRIVDGEVHVSGPSVFAGYWVPARDRQDLPKLPTEVLAQDLPKVPTEVLAQDLPKLPTEVLAQERRWFATGDAGEWDDAGYLRIVGRKKELIIVGGVNVSPAEVEGAYQGLPGVREVGAVGLPDPDLGEVVGLAVVVEGDPDAALEGVRARGEALSGLKRPRRLLVIAALPRNALGKLQRAALRQQFDATPGPKDPT